MVKKERVKGSIEKRLVFEYFLLCFGLLVGLGWDEKEGEFLFFFSHGSGLFCVIVCLVLGCLDSSLGRKIQRKLNSYGFGPEFKVSFGFGYRNVCVCVGTRNASVRYIQLRLEQRMRIWVEWFPLWLVCITFGVGKWFLLRWMGVCFNVKSRGNFGKRLLFEWMGIYFAF